MTDLRTETTIWKYPIFNGFSAIFDVEMPMDSDVLTMQVDGSDDTPKIWVKVDPSIQNTVVRRFAHIGTGQPVPRDAVYLGTWQRKNSEGSNFVFHVFELPPVL